MKNLLFAITAAALMTIPAGAASVLFGGGQAGPTQGADGAVFSYLQNRYGAANVDYIQTSVGIAGDEAGYDVFVISSTPGSGTIRNKWHNSTTPIVNWEEAVADNGAGEFSITTGRPQVAGPHTVTITGAHPITAGFTVGQNVQIMTGTENVWWSTDAQAPGSVSLAADSTNPANLWLTYIDAGGELLNGGAAPARQVMFGIVDATFNSFTAEGQQLFGQAIDWAGNIPEPSTSGLLGLAGLALILRRRRA